MLGVIIVVAFLVAINMIVSFVMGSFLIRMADEMKDIREGVSLMLRRLPRPSDGLIDPNEPR